MIAFRWSTNLFGCLNIDLCANYEAGRMTFSIYQWHRPCCQTITYALPLVLGFFLGLKKMSMPYWIKSLYMCNHLLWSIDNFQSKAPSRIHCIYKQYLSHTNSLLFFEESKMDHQSFFLSCRLGCHCFRSLQLQMSIQYTNNAWGIKHGLRDWLKSRKKDNLIKFERKT